MKFLKESIITISKEGYLFIQKYPKFRERVKAFEEFLGTTNLDDDRIVGFIEQFFSKRDRLEYHKEHQDIDNNIYEVSCYNFDLETPEITINYKTKDNELYIEGYITYVGQSYINDTEEEGPVISAYHDFSIKIPEDTEDIDLYEYDNVESGGYYYRED